MAELKPCPFCGSNQLDIFYYDPFDGYQGNCGSYVILCPRCRARVKYETKAEAIEAWNRRAEDGK